MTVYKENINLFECDNIEYELFKEKFKPKKTTDDCYTPDGVFEAVEDWARNRYGFTREQVVRPFYPGGDYEAYDYPDGCVVLDNPPFSILSKICAFYLRHGLRFFLFAPGLACINRDLRITSVCATVNIVYHNGASICTSFVTNMEPDYVIMSAPDLCEKIEKANKENRSTRKLKNYAYPLNIVTAARVGYYSAHGTEFAVRRGEAAYISQMDSQKADDKTIFGGGLIVSERAAAERVAAERAAAERVAAERAAAVQYGLSKREKDIIAHLSKQEVG